MSAVERRRQAALALLADRSVASQSDLRALLGQRGFPATQGTISRDLRALGVLKGPGGYLVPGEGAGASRPKGAGGGGASGAGAALPGALVGALRMFMLRAESAGAIVVLKTRPGHAAPLATELDRAALRSAVGTIAGDDTVFVATPSPARAKALAAAARKAVM
jgi:transcriptional regulator of arginine metabolism